MITTRRRGRPAGQPRRLDGFDEIAVARLIRGEPPARFTYQDRWEAVRRLVKSGHSDGQIAYLLGCPRGSILKTRQMLGLEAAVPRGTDPRFLPVPTVPTRPRAMR